MSPWHSSMKIWRIFSSSLPMRVDTLVMLTKTFNLGPTTKLPTDHSLSSVTRLVPSDATRVAFETYHLSIRKV